MCTNPTLIVTACDMAEPQDPVLATVRRKQAASWRNMNRLARHCRVAVALLVPAGTVWDKSFGRPCMFHRVVSRLSTMLHPGPHGCMQ
jgi:hypothetical protein